MLKASEPGVLVRPILVQLCSVCRGRHGGAFSRGRTLNRGLGLVSGELPS
jgi:hypothetical protein